MASNQLPAHLVARYLKAHHYTQTLEAFLKEANISADNADTKSGDWTLEKIVEEKIQFDTSLKFERHGSDTKLGWTIPAPSRALLPQAAISTNVLHIAGVSGGLLVSTANNMCTYLRRQPNATTFVSQQEARVDSPVLSIKQLCSTLAVLTTMSCKLIIYDYESSNIIHERADHSKWVVASAVHKLTTHHSQEDWYMIATASWDGTIRFYLAAHSLDSLSERREPYLSEAIHKITLQSNPESLFFAVNPDNGEIYLVVSRRDSTFVYYYHVGLVSNTGDLAPIFKITEAGRQNLAPHSNAWVAFTPSSLAPSPTDPTLLAVATNHQPHMKLILARLLFPRLLSADSASNPEPDPAYPSSAAAMARRDLALQDREDAAIVLQVSTLAPQTQFSTPTVVWRPDGSGVWVNGDDGIVRGIEAQTGKIVSVLGQSKGGHEAGSKVRCLWAGQIQSTGGETKKEEVLVSGAFDRKAIIWETDSDHLPQ